MSVEETQALKLAPVTGRARIDVLDILRGIAILGIFFMNIPFMANRVWMQQWKLSSIGWAPADQWAWSIIEVTWEGTQRCLLEFLFGAGMMVLTAKAMEPDGPVAVADLYFRRNLWLLAFGLLDIFAFLWVGDILHIYALAALFLFPFRKLGPKALIALGLIWSTATAIGVGGGGVIGYTQRVELVRTVDAAHAAQAQHKPLTKEQKDGLEQWQKKLDRLAKPDKDTQKRIDDEKKAHAGGFWPYASSMWSAWLFIVGEGSLLFGVIEAFSTMLIGIALWKWGVIQGKKSTGFYGAMLVLGYGFGFGARAMGVHEITQFAPIPKTIWITAEYARLCVGLGHIALVNLLVRSTVGAAILSPFKAAGRTAFSLYFCEQFIGLYILFSPWGFNLYARYSYFGMAMIAAAVVVGLLIVANIWQRYFLNGPMEWAWRSLAYCKRQPFRRHSEPVPATVTDP